MPPQKTNNNTVVRYEIHIPAHDKNGKLLNHLLPAIRQLLDKNGIHGRRIHKDIESDWKKDTHSGHTIVFEISDHSDSHSKAMDIARAIKEMGELEGVYINKMPVEHYFV